MGVVIAIVLRDAHVGSQDTLEEDNLGQLFPEW